MIERPDRGALVGAAVSAVFGGMWAFWGSNGASGVAAVLLAVVGLVVGLALAVAALALSRRAGYDARPSLFASGRYRLIVTLEVVAILIGGPVLGSLGLAPYFIAWTAFVVGVHFLAFGRVFTAAFTPIGWALVAAAVLGTVAGVLGGPDLVFLVTGVLSALVLLGAAGRTVWAARN